MGKIFKHNKETNKGVSLTFNDGSNKGEICLNGTDVKFFINGKRIYSLKQINATLVHILSNYLPYIGALKDTDVGDRSITATQFILHGLDKQDNPTTIPITFNQEEGTINIELPDGVTGQVFKELWMEGKCQGTCRNGYPAQYVTSQGGHILVKEANMSEIAIHPELFIGVFTYTQTNGNFVKITWFGNVNDVKTTEWEAQSAVDKILYLDTENTGVRGFTTIQPTAGYRHIKVAVITRYSTGSSENGQILVRPTFGMSLNDLENVDGTTTTFGDDDILMIGGEGNLFRFISKVNFYNSFQPAQYRDEYPSGSWVAAGGAAAPNSVAYTIGGVAGNYLAFTGNVTEERISNNFEVPHDADIDAINAEALVMEIHIHSLPSTNEVGNCRWFFDWAYIPPNAVPIPMTSIPIDVPILEDEQYVHKIVGVEITTLPVGGIHIGGLIVFNVRRTPTTVEDTYPDDMIFKQCALHVPINSIGSRQRYIK